jgi:hypothetical protein
MWVIEAFLTRGIMIAHEVSRVLASSLADRPEHFCWAKKIATHPTSHYEALAGETHASLRQRKQTRGSSAWPRKTQHIARAACHRKAGYLARKLIGLWELDLVPSEIAVVAFPQYCNLDGKNAVVFHDAVNAEKDNLTQIALETRDVKLKASLEKADAVLISCLDYLAWIMKSELSDQEVINQMSP